MECSSNQRKQQSNDVQWIFKGEKKAVSYV